MDACGRLGTWNAEKDGDSLDAVLVESVRAAGRVRQRFISHLGHIHENKKTWLSDRAPFWNQAILKLDALHLGTPERANIEALLDRVVPRPSMEELEKGERLYAEWKATFLDPGLAFIASRKRGKRGPYRTRSAYNSIP